MPLQTKFPDTLKPSAEPGCCTAIEDGRCLLLTQTNGASDGFPLTWLYHWQWSSRAEDERLVLTLTEHRVTIHGRNLGLITEKLSQGTGLHLKVKGERYQGLLQSGQTLITEITIEPSNDAESITAGSDQA